MMHKISLLLDIIVLAINAWAFNHFFNYKIRVQMVAFKVSMFGIAISCIALIYDFLM